MPNYSSVFGGFMAGPGINPAVGNAENTFYWNSHYMNAFDQGLFDSATVDSGNTDSAVLRPGLLLGKVYSTGKVKHWDPAAVDGSQYLHAIMDNPSIYMKDSLGTAQNRFRGGLMIRGAVKPQRLLIPGQANFGISGNAYEYMIRAHLQAAGFLLLDDPVGQSMLTSARFLGEYTMIQAKTADYTVKAYESGTLFTTRGAGGAVNFTLPSAATVGLYFGFYAVADQNLTITAGTADTLVFFNDATGDTVSLQTAGEKIGGSFKVVSDGTGWLIFPAVFSDVGAANQTITVTT